MSQMSHLHQFIRTETVRASSSARAGALAIDEALNDMGAGVPPAEALQQAIHDLQQALKLNPSEPEIMNYLGFGWANRFQHLDQALELLQKAAALRPNSGEIRDSLGWAKYRLGRYPDAVRDLERAVQLAPAQPDINDHLGDAYWRVGRKLEADFQWRRVLSLAPDDKLKGEAQAKIQGGLEALPPTASPPAAVAAAAATGPIRAVAGPARP